jgi:membrane-associated phospholipid phosphatase
MTETMEREYQPSFHPAIRMAAKIISYIFHPLFIPVYMGWFFIYELRIFPQLDAWNQSKLMISFFVNYTFLPLVTMLIATKLGFIESLFLKTQKDRIIPYIATGIFYFWVWYVFKNQDFPKLVVMFSLAVFLASSLGLLVNSYFKISMHSIACGVVLTLFLLMGFYIGENVGFYITIAFLIAGLVTTSRLIMKAHYPFDVYAGLFAGMLAQVVAFLFVR